MPKNAFPVYKLDLSGSRFAGRIEAAAVEGSLCLEHGMDGEKELAHDGTEGLELFEAPIVDNYFNETMAKPFRWTYQAKPSPFDHERYHYFCSAVLVQIEYKKNDPVALVYPQMTQVLADLNEKNL